MALISVTWPCHHRLSCSEAIYLPRTHKLPREERLHLNEQDFHAHASQLVTLRLSNGRSDPVARVRGNRLSCHCQRPSQAASGDGQLDAEASGVQAVSQSKTSGRESSAKEAAIIETLSTVSKALEEMASTLRQMSDVVQLTAESCKKAVSALSLLENEGQLDGQIAETITEQPSIKAEDTEQGVAGMETVNPLTIRLQQAFYQSRIDGLGKPIQAALEDFVDHCMEAIAQDISLADLQLQLILVEASLPEPFSPPSISTDYVRIEEARIRSAWVRLVYTTAREIARRRDPSIAPLGEEDDIAGTPILSYVREALRMQFESGYDLERLKLEQSLTTEDLTPSIKSMRQMHYLILLTAAKAMYEETL